MTVREKPKKLYYDETCIKLFIGQIPRAWTEKEIMNVFSRFGEIFDLQILNDRITGLSRGCAFLTYQLNDSAYACIEKFHGLEEGVRLKVKVDDRTFSQLRLSNLVSYSDMSK